MWGRSVPCRLEASARGCDGANCDVRIFGMKRRANKLLVFGAVDVRSRCALCELRNLSCYFNNGSKIANTRRRGKTNDTCDGFGLFLTLALGVRISAPQSPHESLRTQGTSLLRRRTRRRYWASKNGGNGDICESLGVYAAFAWRRDSRTLRASSARAR